MSIIKLRDEITELTEQWYSLIGKDHHKDRDCHFHITTTWSYGHSPQYRVEHYGYIEDDFVETYPTYHQALVALRQFLRDAIDNQKNMPEVEEIW